MPQGVTITQATLTIVPAWWRLVDMDVDIQGDLTVPAEPFFSWTTSISSRTRTEAQAVWHIRDLWLPNVPVVAPDLKDVIQEIVNNPAWHEKSPVALLLFPRKHGERRDRIFYAYDGAPNKAARLKVCYIVPVLP